MFFRSLLVMVVLGLSGGSAIALTDAIASADPFPSTPWRLAQKQSRPKQSNWLRSLNLSPEQVQQIQEIRNRYRDRLTTERQAVRQAQQELKQLMASNASAEKIRQQFDQLQFLKQKLGDTRMESMLAIRNVLNAEQRQKLSEVLRQMGQTRDRGEDW